MAQITFSSVRFLRRHPKPLSALRRACNDLLKFVRQYRFRCWPSAASLAKTHLHASPPGHRASPPSGYLKKPLICFLLFLGFAPFLVEPLIPHRDYVRVSLKDEIRMAVVNLDRIQVVFEVRV